MTHRDVDMKKTVLTYSTIFCLLSTVFLMGIAFNIQTVKAEPAIWTVDDDGPADFSSVKEAINSPQVMDGDTIYVYNGTYCHHEYVVVVDKIVLLIGESKDAIIHGFISIRADNVTIRDFTIRDGNVVVGDFFQPTINATIRENTLVNGGISIRARPVPSPIFGNHTIEENTIINASIGINIFGSAGNKIIGNTLRDGGVGIRLDQDADNTTVLDNQVEGCEVGIYICSFNNTLSGNAMNDDMYSFGFGRPRGAYPNSVDTSNTINDRPVYFIVNQSNILVDPISYPSPGYLALINCENATVKDLILSGNGQGILLQGGEGNTLCNNTLVDNVVGLHVISSDRNELTDNTISDNGIGMRLVESNFNNIANSEFENNTRACFNKLRLIDRSHPIEHGVYGDLSFFYGWVSGALILEWESSSNTIVGNTMIDSDLGVFLDGSGNNTLRNNAMTGNILNFALEISRPTFSYFNHDIDDSNTVDGKPMIYWVNEHGKQVPNNAGYVAIVNSSEITIKNLDIRNNMPGILSISSNNSLISGNKIADCPLGILVMQSYEQFPGESNPSIDITVRSNIVVGSGVGISLYSGEGHTVSFNNVSGNMAGIYVKGAELNIVSGNIVTNCTKWGRDKIPHEFWGVHSPYSYVGSVGICIETPVNVVVGNTIGYNEIGMTVGLMTRYGNNIIHHNNFINNTYYQVLTDSKNVWDAGYPLGGNYWSNYTGVDSKRDGMGDSSHVIDTNNIDNYPLMGMFHSFDTSLGYDVNVISNSTIEDFEYLESNSTIKMYVSGEEGLGFCRVSIPHVLMNVSSILVVIDHGLTPVLYHNYTLCDNGTHRWIYFAYEHSTHKIDIAPEFPTLDTTPPTIPILSPENKTYSVDGVPLTLTVSESTSWIGYSLDGQANVTITGNKTLSVLSDGLHSLIVYANDTAGNTGTSEMVYFTIEIQQEVVFPIEIVAVIVIIGVVGAVAFVYFTKFRK